MNRFPLWKNILVVVVLLAAALVSLPNLFGDEPAVQVSLANGQPLEGSGTERVKQALEAGKPTEPLAYTAMYTDKGRVTVRFATEPEQQRAREALRKALPEKEYAVALLRAPRSPAWLRGLGLKPVPLGLDLRGGVHFLFEVDMTTAIRQRMDAYSSDFTKILRDNRIRRSVSVAGQELQIRLPETKDMDRAEALLRDADRRSGVREA